jgi:hypothetical protein
MAKIKKAFDAVAASRRWRRASSRQLNKMTFAQQQEHLKRVTEALFAAKPSRRPSSIARG